MKSLGNIFSFILIVGVLWYGASFIKSKWDNRERPPFWQYKDMVQVCKKPYYSSEECYKLWVTLAEDKKTAVINFENGSTIMVNRVVCYNAAELDNRPDYVFCRSWDSKNNQWDFMPTWVNY